MEALIDVFKMNELTAGARIKIIEELGAVMDFELGANRTGNLVLELVSALQEEKAAKVKIIELHPMQNDAAWQGAILGLGDDGVVYENRGAGWLGILDNKFI